MPVKPDEIDSIIHERARLAVVSALSVAPEVSFNELKAQLSLTDGNLSAHSRTLEEAGYIAIRKSFSGRKPLTVMRLTTKGRKAFRKYLATLERIIAHGDRFRGGGARGGAGGKSGAAERRGGKRRDGTTGRRFGR